MVRQSLRSAGWGLVWLAGLARAACAQTLAVAPDGGAANAPPAADLVTIVQTAHPVVQGVMALLAACAFAVAVIALHKGVETALVARRLRRHLAAVTAGLPVTAPPPRRRDFAARMIAAAMAEGDAPLPDTLPRRLSLALAAEQIQAVQHWRVGTALLVQVAATAPFIGLFGTVFGIMNSFLAIAASKTSSLSVVAPGIAEALLATAIGLIAAIPAVWVHNWLTRRIAANRTALGLIANRIELWLIRETA